MPNKNDKSDENQTVTDSGTVEAPAEGSAPEVKADENTPPVPNIADISDEINEEIRQGAQNEKKQAKEDEKMSELSPDELDARFEEDLKDDGGKYARIFIFTALGLGAGVLGYLVIRRRRELAQSRIYDEVVNGNVEATETDRYGMEVVNHGNA